MAQDPYGRALLDAGISAKWIEEGTVDPQVEVDGAKGSLWDAVEDMDAGACLKKLKSISAAGATSVSNGAHAKSSSPRTEEPKTPVKASKSEEEQITTPVKAATKNAPAFSEEGPSTTEKNGKNGKDKHECQTPSKADTMEVPESSSNSKGGPNDTEATVVGMYVQDGTGFSKSPPNTPPEADTGTKNGSESGMGADNHAKGDLSSPKEVVPQKASKQKGAPRTLESNAVPGDAIQNGNGKATKQSSQNGKAANSTAANGTGSNGKAATGESVPGPVGGAKDVKAQATGSPEGSTSQDGTTKSSVQAAPLWKPALQNSDPLRVVGLTATFEMMQYVAEGCVAHLCRAAQVSRLWRDTVAETPLAVTPGSAEEFRTLAAHFGSHIEELDLGLCGYTSDAAMCAALAKCSRALHISLADSNAGDHTLAVLGRDCEALQSVDAMGCIAITNEGIKELATGSPQLTSINLSDCHLVSDSGLAYLGECCPELLTISLRHCGQISDDGLGWLAEDCPKLEVLNLMGCADISDVGCLALARHCPALQSVNLSGCNISDAAVVQLADQCRDLMAVDVSRCSQITDVSLRALGKNSTLLESLFLQSCSQVTDQGLIALGAGCKGLALLSVEGCGAVTTCGVTAILENCSEMEALYVQRCNAVNRGFESGFPQVEIVRSASWDHLSLNA